MCKKLNLVWRGNSDTFLVGELQYNELGYFFKYNVEGVKAAMDEGFQLLDGFCRINSKYFSEEPFKLFIKWANNSQKHDENYIESLINLSHDKFSFIENNQSDVKPKGDVENIN